MLEIKKTPKELKIFFALVLAFCIFMKPSNSFAEGLPYLDIIGEASTPQENAFAVKQLVLLTILTLIPSIILMLTPFVRISIVLSIMRQSLGLNQSPPNQVLLALSLFMTIIAMTPTITKINSESIEPYMNNKISIEQAIENANAPIREHMFKQVGKDELSLFINLNSKMANAETPKKYADVPNTVLYPAYMVSEIKTGIFIGIIVSIAFVLVDLATSSILMGMQMMMLSPQVISIVFKLMLFIFANGFEVIIQATMLSIK